MNGEVIMGLVLPFLGTALGSGGVFFMRRELRKKGISGVKCVYSKEEPLIPDGRLNTDASGRRATPGSVSFVPSVMGLIMAGEVIKDLIKE